MSEIDPVAFGKLIGMVEATQKTTDKILEKFDAEIDDHESRIKGIESSQKTIVRGAVGIGAIVGSVKAFFAWVI